MWCDHAFYVGATAANATELGELECLPGAAGIKVFMGASTGDLLVSDDKELARVLAHGRRRVAIHAEDETRMQERANLRVTGDPASHPVWRDDESAMLATRRIVQLAREAGRRIHVLHVTTPAELEFPWRKQGHRHLRGDAPAPDAGRRGGLSSASAPMPR